MVATFSICLTDWLDKCFQFYGWYQWHNNIVCLTAIISFALLPLHQDSLPLLITMGLSCVVFEYLMSEKKQNICWRCRKYQYGSFLGYFMIKTILDSGQLGYILSVYGIDAVVTIINRLIKKENIFQPHRSHLYQYLANEMGYSHVFVDCLCGTSVRNKRHYYLYKWKFVSVLCFSFFTGNDFCLFRY
jgi:hypothetical protein